MLSNLASSYISGDYKLSWNILDNNKPIFITFDNRGEVGDFSNRTGWGSNFFIKEGINFLSFMALKATWFLEDNFYECLNKAIKILECFSSSKRIGYAGSMGAYAALLYRDKLSLTDLVLFNPITTLNYTLAPWENRFKNDIGFFHNAGKSDSITFPCENAAKVVVFYDPLCKEDRLHARRIKCKFEQCIPIHLYGAGHGTPIYLSKLGFLKKLVCQLNEGNINNLLGDIKDLRYKQIYYNGILSSERAARSPWMRKILLVNKVINTPQNLHEKYSDLAIAFSHEDSNLSKKLLNRAKQISPNNNILSKIDKNLWGDGNV